MCRQHIRVHYKVYKERCSAENIKENHHTIPRAAGDHRGAKKTEGQTRLDGMFIAARPAKAFSRRDVLKTVAEFVVCDDQVGVRVLLVTKG